TEAGRAVKDVTIHRSEDLSFQNNVDVISGENGHYTFEHNTPGQQYYLKGYKNTDCRNGVSTLDLIAIQKHLLGTRKLESPYQLIAADANHNDKISVLDMLELRKLILGFYTELPHNTSWRFGNANKSLEANYPWGFKETIEIEALGEDIKQANFVAVKIGDVTGDARPGIQGTELSARTSKTLQLEIEDTPVTSGVPVKMDITSRNFTDVIGLQLALQVKDLEITEIVSGKLDIENENFNSTKDGLLYLSWNVYSPLTFGRDDILFSIIVTPIISGNLSGLVHLATSSLQPEAYSGDNLEKINLDLVLIKPENKFSTNTLFQNNPNPFSSTTEIKFRLENSGLATIRIFDLSGHLLKEINGEYLSGMNKIQVSNHDLGMKDGVLICQLQCNGFLAVQRMVMMK
ncbi:MAG: T9SS type A sorting domain-containing protein, partial [Saprospiraceae bacterium]